jgi:hypothetical protein
VHRSYCIALICPTPAVRELAKAADMATASWTEVCANAEITKIVLADLQAVVKGKLAKFEVPTK